MEFHHCFHSLSLAGVGVGSWRAHFGHNYPILKLSWEDSISLKSLSDGTSGKGQNLQTGKTRRFLSPVGGIYNYLPNKEKSRRTGMAMLAGVSWSELELDCRGDNTGTTPCFEVESADPI